MKNILVGGYIYCIYMSISCKYNKILCYRNITSLVDTSTYNRILATKQLLLLRIIIIAINNDIQITIKKFEKCIKNVKVTFCRKTHFIVHTQKKKNSMYLYLHYRNPV